MLAEKEVIEEKSIQIGEAEAVSIDAIPTENPATAAESSAPVADTPKPAKQKIRRGQLSVSDVITWFSACARCSFFLAGYRLENGANGVETAVHDSMAGWLALDWSQSLCRLARKSYGSRLDIDCYHFEGSCPECRRHFTYRMSENGESGRFRIELKPRLGR